MDPSGPHAIGPYQLHDVIGEGAFALVRLATREDLTIPLACKIVPRLRLQTSNLAMRFDLEIRVVQQLHHPGVVHLVDILSDENNFYVIMEFCEGGELFQHVVNRGHLSEPDAKPFIHQILEALSYVHERGVCHRDLKPENLLLDSTGHVKISDFGLSRFVRRDGLVETPCGSPCYVSPECISGRPYDGRKSDLWSVGVITYALLTGQLPWTKRNQQQLFEQIRKGEFNVPAFLSAECRHFICALMTVDCNHRISIEAALAHPWITNASRGTACVAPDVVGLVSLRRLDLQFAAEVSVSTVEAGGEISSSESSVFSEEQTDNFLRLPKF
jgi:serine/threonine protein kinase